MIGQNKNLIIIRMDGGICSQIAFLALGLCLEKQGFLVKYDLSWFHECGKDNNGVFSRNYELSDAFPGLLVATVEKAEFSGFIRLFDTCGRLPHPCRPPLYVSGYPRERLQAVWDSRDILRQNFTPVFSDSENCRILERIRNSNACAVHIRRGDLSTHNPFYGSPPDEQYFLKTIKMLKSLQQDITFYFFSEEPNWVKNNVIPYLEGTEYEVCTQNNSSKGYIDLYLMAQCRHIITSHGSFGFFAKLLSPYNDGFFVSFGHEVLGSNACDLISKFKNAMIVCRSPIEHDVPSERMGIASGLKRKIRKILAVLYRMCP